MFLSFGPLRQTARIKGPDCGDGIHRRAMRQREGCVALAGVNLASVAGGPDATTSSRNYSYKPQFRSGSLRRLSASGGIVSECRLSPSEPVHSNRTRQPVLFPLLLL